MRYWQNHSKEKQEMVRDALAAKYSGTQDRMYEAVRSCGLAAQTIMLAARQMGLDSCPMIGFDPDRLAKVIHLPENHTLVMMVTVGRAAEPAGPRGG